MNANRFVFGMLAAAVLVFTSGCNRSQDDPALVETYRKLLAEAHSQVTDLEAASKATKAALAEQIASLKGKLAYEEEKSRRDLLEATGRINSLEATNRLLSQQLSATRQQLYTVHNTP